MSLRFPDRLPVRRSLSSRGSLGDRGISGGERRSPRGDSSRRFRSLRNDVFILVIMFGVCGVCIAGDAAATRPVLRIAADPNNLPFTNDKCEGFENKIAELIARDLDAAIEYTWWAQRRGFFRENLK